MAVSSSVCYPPLSLSLRQRAINEDCEVPATVFLGVWEGPTNLMAKRTTDGPFPYHNGSEIIPVTHSVPSSAALFQIAIKHNCPSNGRLRRGLVVLGRWEDRIWESYAR